MHYDRGTATQTPQDIDGTSGEFLLDEQGMVMFVIVARGLQTKRSDENLFPKTDGGETIKDFEE